MTGGDGFVLGVDFGTSNTVAMLRRPDGRVTPLLFDGTPVLPSAVFAAPDGTLFVGRDALHHGRHRPDGLEPNPKRRIDDGTVLLSGVGCAVPDLVGAVLGRVADEATRVAGHRPETLVLSHPAGWGPVRRLTLSDAAAAAGLPRPVFVPEPVAAAMYFTSVLRSSVPTGAALLVYDLGAGTFDVTVLRAGASFEVLGSDGLDDVGGLDVDAAVVTWLRDQYDDATWERLTRAVTDEDRRLRLDLWSEARVAKEMLSRAASVVMRPPLLDQEIPLTLTEFERITQPLIDRTVRTAQGLARYCEVTAAQVLLVGGSSRIPLVATALHRAFGVPPTVTEQPETVVAEGCVFAPGVPPPNPPASVLIQGEHDPVALSTVLPIGAGLSTEPFTGDFTTAPGALPAAPLGRSVLPAMPSETATPRAAPLPAPDPTPARGVVPGTRLAPGPAANVPATETATETATAPANTPATRPATAPANAPATRPATAPANAPATRPATAPANAPATRPATTPANAPATPPGTGPATVSATEAGTGPATVSANGPATLPASSLPPGAIPEARAGEVSVATGLLWPPLPATIAPHPLAAGPDSTADTARLVPVSAGVPRNAGPVRQVQRSAAGNAPSTMSLGPTTAPPDRNWPSPAPPPDDAVTGPPPPEPSDRPERWDRRDSTAELRPVGRTRTVEARQDEWNRATEARRDAWDRPAQALPGERDRTAASPTVPVVPRQARPGGGEQARPAPAGRPAQPARARAAVALLAVVLLLAAAAVTLIVTVPGGGDRFGARSPARSSGGPPFPAWAVRYADSLATQRGWSAAANPDEKVECAFRNGRLEIDMRKGGIFRCPGQRDELTDFALRMDVFLLDGRTCAGIWFRRGSHEGGKDSSYVLKVCRTELVLGHHHANGDIAEFDRFRIDELGTGIRSVVGLAVRGGDISVYLHDVFVGAHHDRAFDGGRVALGIAVPRDLGAGRVGFGNIELRTP